MLPRLYALLPDAHGTDAPILVFTARDAAERAMQERDLTYGEIVAFTCMELLQDAVNGLIYLAVSLEDSGLRIQAAFRSMLGLRRYLDEHVGENPCVPATGYIQT